MESHLAATDNNSLVSSFVHKLGPQQDWALARSEHKWFPSGGNSYSTVGVRQIRFDMTSSSSHFLDPLSCVLQFRIVNDGFVSGNADTNIHMAASAHALFRRIRVTCGGVVVSDEDFVNRLARMYYEFIP